ncbi:hypothetical protein HYALB_00004751 [Hymenoscyphus albidus]|uniref:Uncharacterized protein n=1 Tax=Hymenoscyphus albidus TaxID=595503 RepID=A0A9N9Q0U8_9HELO|nr:hypothetical protein HYALB_00004751 [Hymenoscyphus albidus]
MVYCRKPSQSCADCRSRRTKPSIVFTPPNFHSVIGKDRHVHNVLEHAESVKYRDPSDLMFRDESRNLIAKAQRQSPPKSRTQASSKRIQSIEKEIITRAVLSTGSHFVPSFSVPIGLETSTEEQATAFFFQNYVPDRTSFPTGAFQYLEDIFIHERSTKHSKMQSQRWDLQGYQHSSPNILPTARIKYTSSMKLLSLQSKDAKEAKSNQTFAGVMLLGLYEVSCRLEVRFQSKISLKISKTITCHEDASMEAWTRHTLGSSAIMRYRGRRQLREPLGRELFLHHRSQVLANCMQRHAFVPPFIRQWNETLDMENPCEHSATVLNNISDFNPEATIIRAHAIDAECVKWEQNCPAEYVYRTFQVKRQSEEVFNGRYDVYSNLWIAMIWNNQRSLRIRCQDLILNQLNRFYRTNLAKVLFNDVNYYQRQIRLSKQIILNCSVDIMSSIPGFLGFKDEPNTERKIPSSFNDSLLLWPLFNAGYNDIITNAQRDWIVGRLRYILDVLSVRQAQPLIENLIDKTATHCCNGPPRSPPILSDCRMPGDSNSAMTPYSNKTLNSDASQLWDRGISTSHGDNSLASLSTYFATPQQCFPNFPITPSKFIQSSISTIQNEPHAYESGPYQPNSRFINCIYDGKESPPSYTTFSSDNDSSLMLEDQNFPDPCPITTISYHMLPYQTFTTSMPLENTRGLDAMSGFFEGQW